MWCVTLTDKPLRTSIQAKTLTQNEARRIAANIARLSELLGRGQPLLFTPRGI